MYGLLRQLAHFSLDKVADGPVHPGAGGQALRVIRFELLFGVGQVLEQRGHVIAYFTLLAWVDFLLGYQLLPAYLHLMSLFLGQLAVLPSTWRIFGHSFIFCKLIIIF